ncbi:MAG: putative lipid II flippase FtsW [Euzebyales bacterium]|nr:putative lipid II flippase FtsW [Euzebyales bacterium]
MASDTAHRRPRQRPTNRPRRQRPSNRRRPAARTQRARLTVAGGSTPEFLLLAATTTVLLVVGLVMTFSASFVQSASTTGDAFWVFQRQLLWCAVGVVPMALVALTDYRGLRRFAFVPLLAGIVMAAVVLVEGVGVDVNGARRWLDLGPVRFQPSELLKLAVPLYVSHLLALRWPRIRRGDLRALLVPAVPVIGLAALLTLLGPDLETALLIGVIGGLALYAAGLPTRIIAAGGVVGGAIAAGAIVTTPFRLGRLAAWLDPMAYRSDIGYQTVQGYLALGSGGVFGRGLGQGRGQWLFIPNPHTDFIFAVIGEELGLVGACFVLALFCSLAVGGIRTARKAPDVFGRLLATAITGWLLLQGAMNMGSVVGLVPVTGVTLPLVSFGGSSLVVTMAGVGILLSIARAGRSAATDEQVEER